MEDQVLFFGMTANTYYEEKHAADYEPICNKTNKLVIHLFQLKSD